MPAPVFSLDTSGANPKATTQEILEAEINRVVGITFDQANPEDRDAAALSAAKASAAEIAAQTFRDQAQVAAIAAGAPIVTSLTSPVPAIGTVEIVQTASGGQVWQVVAGAWDFIGWVSQPLFSSIAGMAAADGFIDGQTVSVGSGFNGEPEAFVYVAASTLTADGALVVDATGMGGGRLISARTKYETVADMLADQRSFAAGTRLEANLHPLEAVATGADITLAGGQGVTALPDSQSRLNISSLGLTGAAAENDVFDRLAARGEIALGGSTVRLEEYDKSDKAVRVLGPGTLTTTTEARPVLQLWGPYAHVFRALTVDQPNSATFGGGVNNDHSPLMLRGSIGASVSAIRGDGTDLGVHVGYGLASALDRRSYRNTVSDIVLTNLRGMGIEIFGTKQSSFTEIKVSGNDGSGARGLQHAVRLTGFDFAVNEEVFIQATCKRMQNGLSVQQYSMNCTAFIAAEDCANAIEVHGQDQGKTVNGGYTLRGTTSVGNSVTVTHAGTDYPATVDGNGAWLVTLPEASFTNYGYYTVTVNATGPGPETYTIGILWAPQVPMNNTFHVQANRCDRVLYDGGSYNTFHIDAISCVAGIFQQADDGVPGLSIGNTYKGRVIDGQGRLLDCRGDDASYDLMLVGRNTTAATFGALVQGDNATGQLNIRSCGTGLQINGNNAILTATVKACGNAVVIAGANCTLHVDTDGDVTITGAGCTLTGRVGGTISRTGAGADANISGVTGYSLSRRYFSQATDASGYVTITHNLGVLHSCMANVIGAYQTAVTGITDNSVTLRVYTPTGTVAASVTGLSIDLQLEAA